MHAMRPSLTMGIYCNMPYKWNGGEDLILYANPTNLFINISIL